MTGNITRENEAAFVLSYMSPVTANDVTIEIKMKLVYQVDHAFYHTSNLGSQYVVMGQSFKYNTPMYDMKTTWHFDEEMATFIEPITIPTVNNPTALFFSQPYQEANGEFIPLAN